MRYRKLHIAIIFLCFLISLDTMAVTFSHSREQLLSDSLFAKGIAFYNSRRYNEAIKLFAESDKIDKVILDPTSNRRYYSSMWMASCYYLLGDTLAAIAIDPEFYRFKPVDRRLTVKSDSLSAVGVSYYRNGDYPKAAESMSLCAEIERNAVGRRHQWFANTLYLLGTARISNGDASGLLDLKEYFDITSLNYPESSIEYIRAVYNLIDGYSNLGDYDDAIKFGLNSLDRIEKSIIELNVPYIAVIEQLAYCFYSINSYPEAIKFYHKTLSMRERAGWKMTPEYALTLSNLAEAYFTSGAPYEAIKCAEENLAISQQIFGKTHKTRALYLQSLAQYYSSVSNFQKAINLYEEALDIYRQTVGDMHPEYATCLSGLASNYKCVDNYSKAIQLGYEALNIQEHNFGKTHSAYAGALQTLAQSISASGNYAEAIRIETEALKIRQQCFGRENMHCAFTLSELASDYSKLGNYSEAIRYGAESVDIRKRLLGEHHPEYAYSLAALAIYNSYLGNYSESIKLSQSALGVYKESIGKDNLDYTSTLMNLSLFYSYENNYTKSIELASEAKDILDKVVGKKHTQYAICLMNSASFNLALKNYSEAQSLAYEGLDIFESICGKSHPDYIKALGNLGNHYIAIGDFGKASDFYEKAADGFLQVFDEMHPEYIDKLIALTLCDFWNGNIANANANASKVSALKSRQVRSLFANLTNSERRNLWNANKIWFETIIHYLAYRIHSETMCSNGYDAILMAKGVLLNSERNFADIIKDSNDPEVISTYEKLQTTLHMLDRLYEKPISERFASTDSLEATVHKLEIELIGSSKAYGDFTSSMSIGWKDVQKKLRPKDVAIEFASFPLQNDSVIYAAYVIAPKMKCPEMVTLFEKHELEGISSSNYYSTSELSRLVWGKLGHYISNAENIYFSPAGELYNIAIESLPAFDCDGFVSDSRNFFRMSSTRQLAVAKDIGQLKSAVLYGGLKYDVDIDILTKDSSRYPDIVPRGFPAMNLPDSLQLRHGVSFLPATKVEVENIDLSFKQNGINPQLYTDSIGTEASFKALDGKGINIMHIATHGFYWTDKEARKIDFLSFLKMDNQRFGKYIEDKALTRSGLLFTGANNALMGRSLPENTQDGLLTAQEISMLDLHGLDMVVMSACQTGVGEITGDGVFGLQRGFKEAGANTLLMSLWKVDDRATQMLMTKFYNCLLSGKSKLESLTIAQKFVREYEEDTNISEDADMTASQRRKSQRLGIEVEESHTATTKVKPFADPKYWAAFVLLDALN